MELRQLKYFIKVREALSRSGLDPSILGAIYIGTIHAYCKFLLGEMDARYRQYEVLDPNRMADIYSEDTPYSIEEIRKIIESKDDVDD